LFAIEHPKQILGRTQRQLDLARQKKQAKHNKTFKKVCGTIKHSKTIQKQIGKALDRVHNTKIKTKTNSDDQTAKRSNTKFNTRAQTQSATAPEGNKRCDEKARYTDIANIFCSSAPSANFASAAAAAAAIILHES